MKTRVGAAPRLIGAIVAALVAGLSHPAPAGAQQSGASESAGKPTSLAPGHGKRSPAKAAAKRAPESKSAPRDSATRGGTADLWKIDDALLNTGYSTGRPLPADTAAPAKRPLGRIQLDTGSLGFQTESMVKDNRFSDGRSVPGLETDKRNTPSYFGLSLSVPTHDKSLIPVPMLPRPE